MATAHAESGELIDIRPFGPALPQIASETLVRAEHLEVFRLVLLAGRVLPGHDHRRPVTIQCVEGWIDLVTGDKTLSMPAGSLVYLAGGTPHELRAVEDSLLLITLLVRRE
ncbi:MAG TPA: cupin domain-containing protein [Casimicrobiaceae bacterium]|nr:cupin domain-containing protein [Casimicrobiaceae bacterium]